MNTLLGCKPVNSIIIATRFQGQLLNLSIIEILLYSLKADSEEAELEEFYEKLELTLKELLKKDVRVRIITGPGIGTVAVLGFLFEETKPSNPRFNTVFFVNF